MQREDPLLLHALDRDRLDARLLHRLPDRACVVRIVLVVAHEWPDHLRRKQPNLVTELLQPACPMLRTAAGLHRHQARRAVGEVLQKLRPRQPHVHDLTRLHVHRVQLKYPLLRIHMGEARPGEAEVIEHVIERLTSDGHAERSHAGEVGQALPARLVLLAEDHLLLGAHCLS